MTLLFYLLFAALAARFGIYERLQPKHVQMRKIILLNLLHIVYCLAALDYKSLQSSATG